MNILVTILKVAASVLALIWGSIIGIICIAFAGFCFWFAWLVATG